MLRLARSLWSGLAVALHAWNGPQSVQTVRPTAWFTLDGIGPIVAVQLIDMDT